MDTLTLPEKRVIVNVNSASGYWGHWGYTYYCQEITCGSRMPKRRYFAHAITLGPNTPRRRHAYTAERRAHSGSAPFSRPVFSRICCRKSSQARSARKRSKAGFGGIRTHFPEARRVSRAEGKKIPDRSRGHCGAHARKCEERQVNRGTDTSGRLHALTCLGMP